MPADVESEASQHCTCSSLAYALLPSRLDNGKTPLENKHESCSPTADRQLCVISRCGSHRCLCSGGAWQTNISAPAQVQVGFLSELSHLRTIMLFLSPTSCLLRSFCSSVLLVLYLSKPRCLASRVVRCRGDTEPSKSVSLEYESSKPVSESSMLADSFALLARTWPAEIAFL